MGASDVGSRTIACGDAAGLARVRTHDLVEALGLSDGEATTDSVHPVCDTMQGAGRPTYRDAFYDLPAPHPGKEAVSGG